MKILEKNKDKWLNEKNKELFSKICLKCNISNEAKAAELLNQKGYIRYVNAQSVKNRFRSGSTRTDFFWHLLDATDCSIEIVKKGEPTREELLAEIATLKNEQDMLSNIYPEIELLKTNSKLAAALGKIEDTLESIKLEDHF